MVVHSHVSHVISSKFSREWLWSTTANYLLRGIEQVFHHLALPSTIFSQRPHMDFSVWGIWNTHAKYNMKRKSCDLCYLQVVRCSTSFSSEQFFSQLSKLFHMPYSSPAWTCKILKTSSSRTYLSMIRSASMIVALPFMQHTIYRRRKFLTISNFSMDTG